METAHPTENQSDKENAPDDKPVKKAKKSAPAKAAKAPKAAEEAEGAQPAEGDGAAQQVKDEDGAPVGSGRRAAQVRRRRRRKTCLLAHYGLRACSLATR